MAESGIESSNNVMLSDELKFGLDDELYELLGDVDSDGETSTYKRMLRMVIKERFWQMYRSLDFFLKRFIIDKSRLKGEHKDTAADVARISSITKEALQLILHSHGAQTAAKFADLEGVKRFELVKCLMPGMLMPSVILRSENTVVFGFVQFIGNYVQWNPFVRFKIEDNGTWLFQSHVTVAAQKKTPSGIWGWLDSDLEPIVGVGMGLSLTGHGRLDDVLLGLQALLQEKPWKLEDWEEQGAKITVATSDSANGSTWVGEKSALPTV